MDVPLVNNQGPQSMKTALESLMSTATPKGKLTQYIGLKNGCFVAKNIGLTNPQKALCVFLSLFLVLPGYWCYKVIKQCVRNDEAAAKAAATHLSGEEIKPDFGTQTQNGYIKNKKEVEEYAKSKLSLEFCRLPASDRTENGYFMVNVNPSNASKTAGKAAVAAKAARVPREINQENLDKARAGAAAADKTAAAAAAATTAAPAIKVARTPKEPQKQALFNNLNRIKNPDAILNRLEQIASGNIRNVKSRSGALKALVIDKPHYYAAALADPECSKTIADCPNLIQMLEGGGNLAVSLSAYECLVEQLQNNIVSVDTKSEEKVFSYLEKLNNIIPLMDSGYKSTEIQAPQKVLLSGLITKAQALQKSLQGKLNALRQGNRNPLLEAALGGEDSETEALNAILPPFLSPAGSSPTMVYQNLLDPKGSPPCMVNPWA